MMGKIIMELIKAEIFGVLTAQQIHDIACTSQQNINASNSVISNDDLPIIKRIRICGN